MIAVMQQSINTTKIDYETLINNLERSFNQLQARGTINSNKNKNDLRNINFKRKEFEPDLLPKYEVINNINQTFKPKRPVIKFNRNISKSFKEKPFCKFCNRKHFGECWLKQKNVKPMESNKTNYQDIRNEFADMTKEFNQLKVVNSLLMDKFKKRRVEPQTPNALRSMSQWQEDQLLGVKKTINVIHKRSRKRLDQSDYSIREDIPYDEDEFEFNDDSVNIYSDLSSVQDPNFQGKPRSFLSDSGASHHFVYDCSRVNNFHESRQATH
jgi:hypothetical protein